jgi:hypothetical protein
VLRYNELMKLETPPSIVLRGQSFLSLRLKQNRIEARDSILFLPGLALSKFASTFGLSEGKGHYPHLLNTPRWVDFDNPMAYEEDGERFPKLAYFSPETSRPKALKELKEWHAEEVARFAADPTLRYYPAYELIKYCKLDTSTLRLGFEKFRQQWLDQFPDMDVFKSLTFPSFANRLFRNYFLKEKSIALLAPMGFEFKNCRGSLGAFGWMSIKRTELKEAGDPVVELRDARRGFECRIGGIRVDGWAKTQSGEQYVFMYHGCYFHKCSTCRPNGSEEDVARYERTLAETAKLQDLGQNPDSPYGHFVYCEIWEHEFKALTRGQSWEADHWREFKKRWPKEPLKPRRAFFGGRTNSIRHDVKVDWRAGWRLWYQDFTSLYPAVNYSVDGQEWPVGVPDIYIGMDVETVPAPQLADAFGLWAVSIHPPKTLLHPVIPQSMNGKLVFVLCSTCGAAEQDGPCFHSRAERAIHGVFFSEELKLAVEYGYEVGTPSEVWDWPKERRTTRLWRRFMRRFFATKAKASAPPSDPAKLQELIEDMWRTVKIRLTPDSFRPNPTARTLSKFALKYVHSIRIKIIITTNGLFQQHLGLLWKVGSGIEDSDHRRGGEALRDHEQEGRRDHSSPHSNGRKIRQNRPPTGCGRDPEERKHCAGPHDHILRQNQALPGDCAAAK